MSDTSRYPKRLIEVDLPIGRISEHARREKSIRHGHISTLHIWWARRPLAACRAVICASLWPDPADPLCPEAFRRKAREEMLGWTSHERQRLLGSESRERFEAARVRPGRFDDATALRGALLDFIADFANWDNSTVAEYLETSRALTQAAHEALGGEPGTRPLVVDPFAGGGSIPLEALRVGADAFASDLNPIPVLLNKVVLEYIPRYGKRLADEVRKWGAWIKEEAEKELSRFYPKDPDGATPIAYLWARTIRCEGPGCGAEVPLIRSLWLAKKSDRMTALHLSANAKTRKIEISIIVKQRDSWVEQSDTRRTIADPKFDGTIRRGAATCLCCGFTTKIEQVRQQLKDRRGGSTDARLICVVTTRPTELGRKYRLPDERDFIAIQCASEELKRRAREYEGPFNLVPDELISLNEIRRISLPLYGMTVWGDLMTVRNALTLTTLSRFVADVGHSLRSKGDAYYAEAVQTCLAFAVSRLADRGCSICTWRPQADQEKVEHVFTRQAIQMTWDFAEGTFLSERTAGWNDAYEPPAKLIETLAAIDLRIGTVTQSSAVNHPLPDDTCHVAFTDPPYYDAIPYAHLSDFFYVWLRRSLVGAFSSLLAYPLVPKAEEIVVDRPHVLSSSTHDIDYYESQLTAAFAATRRVLRPNGLGVIVFASKTTASWEAILQAVIRAGWIIIGSWPIDTEMEARLAAQGQARLASSIHLVCRPRENPDGSLREDEIGDWRDVLRELPRRIHEWMPRLAAEGVVGADAIFACLGPALEIYSRYSRVEKASGEVVTLREYLEKVWEAVGKEALKMIFEGADATGFEEDARLTAMWLWTITTAKSGTDIGSRVTAAMNPDDDDEETAGSRKGPRIKGYVLEFDAARKIAQGLGAHLAQLEHLVEIKGETARLLPVEDRARFLFGKEARGADTVKAAPRKKQMEMFAEGTAADETAGAWADFGESRPGVTVLDRVHQAMLLHAAGRGAALKRFLVTDGAGADERFWRLAQAFSALYPASSDEKRWVDGVLARKKGLGF